MIVEIVGNGPWRTAMVRTKVFKRIAILSSVSALALASACSSGDSGGSDGAAAST
ncbi:MAG: hypothetical protein JWP10_1098 [Nocardioidaceae bacterium]|nr:hypothetical protein [Nocardioidaceae bacterium]